MKITYNQVLIYLSVINVILGFLFGAFPLIAGLLLKNRKYGIWGFIGSIIGGAFLGLFLSFPIALIFTWLILRNMTPKESSNVLVNESHSEVETQNINNS